jgi:hypothetical protein
LTFGFGFGFFFFFTTTPSSCSQKALENRKEMKELRDAEKALDLGFRV